MKRKRKTHAFNNQQTSSSYSSDLQHETDGYIAADLDNLFAIMLAALSKSNSDVTFNLIIKQCLLKFRLSLLQISQTLTTIPVSIISLLPLFLNSRGPEIESTSLEIAGAASICSFEMNEQIALDADIVKGLLTSLLSCEKAVSLAAVNAVLDLSTTSIGRQRLIEFSAIDNLIFCFIQVPKSPQPLVSLFKDETKSESNLRLGFKEDEFPVLLLQATVTLINACTNEILGKVPIKLSESFLVYLKILWAQVHKQMLLSTVPKCKPSKYFYTSNITTNNLAETIFRLSINKASDSTKEDIFSLGEISFEHFILNHWEESPVLLMEQKCDIFSCFLKQFLLGSKKDDTALSFISSFLQNCTNCPPISWDELKILNFLEEAGYYLGCLIIDREDIRILKTQKHSIKEAHFFDNSSRFLYMDDILRCKDAFKDGYTIAMRGMELRSNTIVAIASGLASLFGQPSVGVNMYLTPPNSQGLARHFDDHCVLVCQLIGIKKWRVFTRASPLLPRSYASEGNGNLRIDDNEDDDGCKHFLMREGDVLYIPRGFLHEACTSVENDGFSLHLTLAIEVAPPFEWEGFVHVALDYWDQNQKLMYNDTLSSDLRISVVNLIHIAIKLIGGIVPIFRKACLVGTTSLSSLCFDMNQQKKFTHLLDIINKECKFLDALNSVETAITCKHEDPFLELGWLNHLEGERSMSLSFLISTLHKHGDEAEAAFVEVKSKFCSEVLVQFKDVESSYKLLIEKYRKVKQQYVNGMLSLHCM